MKWALAIMTMVLIAGVSTEGQQNSKKTEARDFALEVLPVPELPLNIHEATLLKTAKGYVLKCRFSNSADAALIGMRYSLTIIDPLSGTRPLTNRIEGFELAVIETKTLTFPTAIRFHPADGSRFVLMLEQVVSRDSIWEVIRAKDVLEAYVKGDYSVQPHVLRVANQVDAPMQTRVIY